MVGGGIYGVECIDEFVADDIADAAEHCIVPAFVAIDDVGGTEGPELGFVVPDDNDDDGADAGELGCQLHGELAAAEAAANDQQRRGRVVEGICVGGPRRWDR